MSAPPVFTGAAVEQTSRRSLRRRDVALAIASGLLVGLAMPRASLHLFIWIAFVPLLHALAAKGRWTGFRLGFVTGVVGYASGFYWIVSIAGLRVVETLLFGHQSPGKKE